MAELVAEEGILKGLVLNLEERDEWIIGRDPDLCHIVLEDAKTSRKHLIIRKVEDHFLLENLSVTNPVSVNGISIPKEIELNDEDQLTIGGNRFRFYREKRKVSLNEEIPLEDSETIFREEEIHELPKPSIDLRVESRFILKVLSGPHAGAEYALDYNKDYVMGSDTSCDIVFHDMSVSRQHAHFFIDDEGKMFIEDLQSRNGVVIDREKIEGKRALLPNSIVTLGTSSFVIIDKEAPSMTIVSPDFKEKKEEAREEIPSEKVVAKTEERRRWDLKSPNVIFPLILAGLIIFLGIGALSLFHESPVHCLQRDVNSEIQDVLKTFPAVQFTYNPCSERLFLVGHVLNDLEKKELLYKLSTLSFVKGVDDNVVIDDAIWQEMNLLLDKHRDFEGVSLHAPIAGKFVLSGYLKTADQKAALNDFMNHNFLYLNLLENSVVVEEDTVKDVKSQLIQKGFPGILPEFTNGVLTLTGSITPEQDESFKSFLDTLCQVCGVRNVRNFVVVARNGECCEPLQGYLVAGFSKYGDININVVINGKILMRGDNIDGYVITCIQPQAIFF